MARDTIKTALAEKLAEATVACDKAEEKVQRCADLVRLHLEKVARAATDAVETYKTAKPDAADLDPSPCLLLAERLEQADRELSHAFNTRTACRREVEILTSLLKRAKEDAKLEKVARALVNTSPGEWEVAVNGDLFHQLEAVLKG